MHHLFLLYADEASTPSPGSPEMAATLDAYGAFHGFVSGSGALKAGDPVAPSSTATTVSVRDGATSTTPGPARPGGEQIIGFYVLDADDTAQAVELAARIPAASHGRVEVRPILVM